MSKLDTSLLSEWELWESRREADPAAAREFEIVARFEGDVAALERAGFRLGFVSGPYAIGYARVSALPALQALDSVESLRMAPKLRHLLDTSVPAIDVPPVHQAPFNLKGSGVVIGIIDDGIDIGHPAFRRPVDSHSRVVRLWDQGGNPGPTGSRAPQRFTLPGILDGALIPKTRYGEEWRREDLTKYLQHHPANYVSGTMPGMEPLARSGGVAHGSHTAGIAGGNGKGKDGCDREDVYIGVAPEADFIIVKQKPKGGIIEFVDAVCYIVQRAATSSTFEDNKPHPVVISCSLSFGMADTNPELHDALMAPINALLAASASRVFVAGAGNEGSMKLHARLKLDAGGGAPKELKFTVAPNDLADDEIDLSWVGAKTLTVRIGMPKAPPASWVDLTSPATGLQSKVLGGHTIKYRQGTPLTIVSKDTGALNIVIEPPNGGAIAPGDWVIALQQPAGLATDVDAWVLFDYSGDPSPRFSTFDKDANMVCAPARARNVIAVGAYDVRLEKGALKDIGLSRYSSHGQVGADPLDTKPDVVAPGTGIVSVRSRARKSPKISECVAFYMADTGTSMAAPHVAGVVALMLQRNQTLWFHEVQKILRSSAKKPGIVPLPADWPNDGWGYGIVSAENAMLKVTASTAPASAAHAGTILASDKWDAPVVEMEQQPHDELSPPASEPEAEWEGELVPGFAERLRSLEPLLQRSVAARLVAALVSAHVDEIARLVNANRRVTAIWRHGGPALVRHLATSSFVEWPIVPAEVSGFSVRALLTHLLPLLQRYGGETLRQDARRYRELIVAVPGAELQELEQLAALSVGA